MRAVAEEFERMSREITTVEFKRLQHSLEELRDALAELEDMGWLRR